MEPEKADTWLDKLEKWARILASGSWRARVNFFLVLLTFLAAAACTGFLSNKNWAPAGVAFLAAAISFGILVKRLRREVKVDLRKLKGPSPFGSADGELFSGLDRDRELSNLLAAVLEDNKAVVFVYGKSGVGKTSIVNAGLRRDLTEKGISNVLYASANQTDTEESLVRQHSATLPQGEPTPSTMADLMASRGKEKQVVIVDDVDLAPDPGRIKAWVELALGQGHPYSRVLILIIGDEEYSRTWSKVWSRQLATLPVEITKFDRTTAKNAARELCEKAKLPVSERVLDDIVDDLSSMDPEDSVSPLSLSVIIQRIADKSGPLFRKEDYRASGYTTGILGAYVEECLHAYAKGDAEIILTALAHQIRDGAARFQVTDLGSSVERVPDPLSVLLNLSQPEVHILSAGRDQTFRVLDDWVPALRASSGSPNPDVAYLENHILGKYKWWHEGKALGKRGLLSLLLSEEASLLTNDDLDRFDRYKGEVKFGDDPKISSYIAHSRSYRQWRKMVLASGAVITIFAAGLFYWMAQGWRDKNIEVALGLPSDFAKLGGQLDELVVVCPVSNLALLPRNLTALEVNCKDAKTINGAPPKLRRLGLSLSGGITSLDGLPRTVQDLDISATGIHGIEGLSNAQLTALDASGVPISNMKLIPRKVTNLKLSSSFIESLEGLPDHLTDLSLVGTNVTHFKSVPNGVPNTVERLTLFGNANLTIDSLPNHLVRLETDLSLKDVALPPSLDTIVFSNLGGVHPPKGIKSIELKNSRLADPFPEDLETLKIDDLKYPVLLGAIPKNVHHLKIIWFEGATFAQLPPQLIELDLRNSQKALTSLAGIGPVKELDISSTKVPDFRDISDSVTALRFESCSAFRLSKFPAHLAKLYLGGCADLEKIDNLPGSLIELDISGTKISHLPTLPDGVTKLDISNTNIRGVLPRLPESLTELTLHMGQIDRFERIPPHLKVLKFKDFEPKK